MNFFRLRILNTCLLFLIGIVAGFILKERFYPSASKQTYAANYRPAFERKAAPGTETGDEESYNSEEPEDAAAPKERPAAAAQRPTVSAVTIDESAEKPLVIEPEPAPRERKADVLRDAKDFFFRNPADYAGRELEMDLQLITVKKGQRGWRLNFVYTAPDKHIDYLYADDSEVLGEKPDLRIGYVYRLRFRCEKGETAAGNILSAVTPTGEKADWATGISAIE